MALDKQETGQRFKRYYREYPTLGLALDVSRMGFGPEYVGEMGSFIDKAHAAMARVEKGDIENVDENRMVGHYWLRSPERAPNASIRHQIEQTVADIKAFAADVHQGKIQGARGPFENLLLIGIGGSALGPQFVADGLGHPARDKIRPRFLDNTDPDGIDAVFARIGPDLGQTLCVVISKSGGTQETRNGMIEAETAFERAQLSFPQHAVAITKEGSQLDLLAGEQHWLRRFPMWDWVGGRTSETSAVGLLPAALQGFEIDRILAGARACDEITREPDPLRNPAMLMALMWYYGGRGHGAKDLVVIPYKDRLALFSRYLQQLVMESLGKEKDLDGKVVNQGLAVYGNKGSTDQHAYIQQLRDGLNNFFVTFIEVLKERQGDPVTVAEEVTAGDYLSGFLLGTRQALSEKGRESITITLDEVTPYSIGVLIALFERTVGLYAPMIHINPYHQPGVEAGKKAAERIIVLQRQVLQHLRQQKGVRMTAGELAAALGVGDEEESIFKICEHLAANPRRGLAKAMGENPWSRSYWFA